MAQPSVESESLCPPRSSRASRCVSPAAGGSGGGGASPDGAAEPEDFHARSWRWDLSFSLLGPGRWRTMLSATPGSTRSPGLARPLEGALGTQWRGHDQGPGLPHSGEGWPPVSPPGEKISSLIISGGGDGGCGEPTVLSLGPVHKSLRRSVRRLNPGLRQDRTPVLPLYYPVPAPIQPPSS